MRRLYYSLSLGAFLMLTTFQLNALEDATLLSIQKLEISQFQEFSDGDTGWSAIINTIIKERYDCLKVFFNQAFCGCLYRELPGSIELVDYVSYVTTDSLDMTLSAEKRALIALVKNVRDRCVVEAL